jgi:amino acid transporter
MDSPLQHRPRELRWYHAAGMLFGDWGTSRLYVLGLAFVLSAYSSFYFILAMAVFMTLVGVSYTIICKHFPDGGGVYSAARTRSPALGVVGALLLYADYIVTAALSTYVGFRYILPDSFSSETAMYCAVITIVFVGLMNVFGPRRTGLAAAVTAIVCVGFYLVIAGACVTHFGEADVRPPVREPGEKFLPFAWTQWSLFVQVVLALSGVEAIANMTGVMAPPVGRNARRAIFVVLAEVVIINLIMAYAMNAPMATAGVNEVDIQDHMVKILAERFVGSGFAAVASVFFGVLLISAANTAISDMVSIQYLMGRDRELPSAFTRLNRYGMPWLPLVTATLAPAAMLLIVRNNTETLASMYAIGVVGAIAINLLACGTNKQLKLNRRETFMLLAVGGITALIEISIAVDKWHALLFAGIVLTAGLTARAAATAARRRLAVAPATASAAPSAAAATAHRAVPFDVPRILVPAKGNPKLFRFAAQYAAEKKAAVFLLFVREVALSFRERDTSLAAEHMTLERDKDAQKVFSDAEEIFKKAGVTVVPIYTVHDSVADVILDYAAVLGVDAVLMGFTGRSAISRVLAGDVIEEVTKFLPESIPLLIYA